MDLKSPGAYLLIIHLPEDITLRVRKRVFHLRKGFYVYVGSAMNGLGRRLRRHFCGRRKLHWHIDFLLEEARLVRAYAVFSNERLEDELSIAVSGVGEGIEGFGASDRRLRSNLYRFESEPFALMERILRRKNLKFHIIDALSVCSPAPAGE